MVSMIDNLIDRMVLLLIIIRLVFTFITAERLDGRVEDLEDWRAVGDRFTRQD